MSGDEEDEIAAPRFAWTRSTSGDWSAHGYEIKRRKWGGWRVLRDGQFWDIIDKLPEAKRACERDRHRPRRLRERPTR